MEGNLWLENRAAAIKARIIRANQKGGKLQPGFSIQMFGTQTDQYIEIKRKDKPDLGLHVSRRGNGIQVDSYRELGG